jgi:hypothetical protein
VEYLVADYLQWSNEKKNDQSAPDGREREVDIGILGFHGLSALSNLLSDITYWSVPLVCLRISKLTPSSWEASPGSRQSEHCHNQQQNEILTSECSSA